MRDPLVIVFATALVGCGGALESAAPASTPESPAAAAGDGGGGVAAGGAGNASDAGNDADAGPPPGVDAGSPEPDAGTWEIADFVPVGPLCEVSDGGDPVRPSCRFAAGRFTDRAPGFVPQQLTYVTWNVKYGAESAKVLDTLKADATLANADFIALQEVPRDDLASKPARVDLARAAAQALKMNYVFAVEWDWRLHPDKTGEHGLAVLSKYPLGEAALLRHAPQHDWWSADRRYGGRATLAVTALVGGKRVRVYSSHLDTRGGQAGRAAQGAEIRAHAQGPDQPALQLVGGDLNTWECNPALSNCSAAPAAERVVQDFLGTWSDGTPQYTGHTQLGVGLFPQRLDWVFQRGLSTISGGCFTSAPGSDHLPLFFRFAAP